MRLPPRCLIAACLCAGGLAVACGGNAGDHASPDAGADAAASSMDQIAEAPADVPTETPLESSDAAPDLATDETTTDASADAAEAAPPTRRCQAPYTFADPVLDAAVHQAAGVSGPIADADLARVHTLTIPDGHLRSLAGLECATQLSRLELVAPTMISDLSPLASMTNLISVILWGCAGPIDVTPLAHLTNLQVIELEQNCGVSDLTPLFGLDQIQWFDFESNHITDLGQFLHFHKLAHLYIAGNPIDCATQSANYHALVDRGVEIVGFGCWP